MKQLENSLYQIIQKGIDGIVLLPQTNEFLGLIPFLLEYVKPECLFCLLPNDKKVADTIQTVYNGKVQICSGKDFIHFNRHVEFVLFDYGSAEHIKKYFKNVNHIIGRMSDYEDYFPLWESCREKAEYIYIEQNRTENKGYEIFEWERPYTQTELSVIIPVYNVEKYLPQCIESLTEWKAPYVEYLFVDDGSPDDSADIIKKYAAGDIRIKLIQKKNGGCASARNQGLAVAKGRYIGFVDADDFVDKHMFYKLLKRAMLGNYDLAYCGYNEYYEESGEAEPVDNECMTKNYCYGEYNPDKVKMLAVNTRVAIWRCLYKKSILNQYNIRFQEKLNRFDDLPYRTEYMFASKSAVCIPEYLYYYRIGRKGQDTACTDERLYVHFNIFEYLEKHVKACKDRKLLDLLQAIELQTHAYGLSKIQKQYRKRYSKKVKLQLKKHAGYFRNAVICFLYAGRGNIGWLTKLWIGLY